MAGGEIERREEAVEESESSDVEVLRSGREEARVVLDHQLQLLSEMHTEAFRTVRLTVLVPGLLVSVTTLPDADRFVNLFTIVGGSCLLLAILFGLGAYSVSNPTIGIGTGYLRDVREVPYCESEWLNLLLRGYQRWIETVERSNRCNMLALVVTRLFLGGGIVLIAVGFGANLFLG